jgi:hypothetical protein
VADEPTAEVVPLFPLDEEGTEASPILTREGTGKGPRQTYCSHDRVELDTDARRVYCRQCGREVPPFDYLKKLARKFEQYTTALAEAKRQTRVAEANLAELKREERNAKARARRRAS